MQLTGQFWDYFVVFWGGVLVSFTPCVYPVLPLTAGFIGGANSQGTRFTAFLISLVYVFGMAISYCSLAVFAALTGKIFGQIQNSPWVFIGVANILLFFALVMLDVVHLPTISVAGSNQKKPKSVWAVLLFGMASGLVIGPCTAPALAFLLVYLASKQNILHAVSLMFVFSYGVGASLILVGTFSGALSNLPKSGPWLVRIKQFCGGVLLLAAEYFLIKAGALMI